MLGIPLACPRPRLFGFDLAVADGSARMQRKDELARRGRNLVDRAIERRGVGLRRSREAGELAHELQRGGSYFVFRCWRLEIKQRLDIAAHGAASFCTIVARMERSVIRERRARLTLSFFRGTLYSVRFFNR